MYNKNSRISQQMSNNIGGYGVIIGVYCVPAVALAVIPPSPIQLVLSENGVIIIVYYYNVTSLYSSGGLRPPQQSMIQTILSVMVICILLGAAETRDLRYL